MLCRWIGALLVARRPYLLCWRVGGEERCHVFAHLWDALWASQATLQEPGLETMELTDRDGCPLPIPSYARLTWRWGVVTYGEVLVGRRAWQARVRSLRANAAAEFVSLTRSDGQPFTV